MGIKTTVHQIIAAKQNLSVPDPVTHDDFLKCEFFNLCVLDWKCSLNIDFRATTVRLWLGQPSGSTNNLIAAPYLFD